MDFRITQKQFQKVLDDVKGLKAENAELRKLHAKKKEKEETTTQEAHSQEADSQDSGKTKTPAPKRRRRLLDLFRRDKE